MVNSHNKVIKHGENVLKQGLSTGLCTVVAVIRFDVAQQGFILVWVGSDLTNSLASPRGLYGEP